ncbi:MAG TPA: dipeptidase [Gemmatimonadaceae bacterium]|nr:dipeptidase [Gemmatimonadaceae bacterium]
MTDPALSRALRVLETSPVFDGHNDLPWRIREHTGNPPDVDAYDLHARTPGMTDLARLRAGRVGAQFWAAYTPGERDNPAYAPNGGVTSTPGYARVMLDQIDVAHRLIASYAELEWAPTVHDIRGCIARRTVASLIGVEGGHGIENSLGILRTFRALGVRYMTLTHNVTTDWADAALGAPLHGGLTPFGRDVIREMNRLAMLVDLAHASPDTMRDALDTSHAPVMFTHSGARALCDHPRNVPDAILARIPANGGIVMVPFLPSFVSATVKADDDALEHVRTRAHASHPHDPAAAAEEIVAWRDANPRPQATLADVADMIEYVRSIVGVQHVGIGSDFDGFDETTVGLEDVSTYPALFAELARRGWSDEDLAKLACENVLRVLGDAETAATRRR